MRCCAILDDLVRERGMGLIFISHNLDRSVSSFCDRVLIMYGGRIVESCRRRSRHAQHPYTAGLLAAGPSIAHPRDDARHR